MLTIFPQIQEVSVQNKDHTRIMDSSQLYLLLDFSKTATNLRDYYDEKHQYEYHELMILVQFYKEIVE